MVVWILRDNPSRRFYERLGGKLRRLGPTDIRGRDYEGVAYGWQDVRALLRSLDASRA